MISRIFDCGGHAQALSKQSPRKRTLSRQQCPPHRRFICNLTLHVRRVSGDTIVVNCRWSACRMRAAAGQQHYGIQFAYAHH